MIKAVILDIDGVILGHRERTNFPFPSVSVQKYLQNLSKDMPVSLCTVKAYFAVKPLIVACGIQDYFHITDAGATLVNATTHTVTTNHIEGQYAKELIEELRKSELYVEWYSGNEYFALPNENSLISDARTILFGRPATILSQPTSPDISKIIAFPLNEWQETTLLDISKKYSKYASLHWGINPTLIPRTNAFFTNPAATKRTGAERISELNGIPLSDTLAIGDSTNDWTFMGLCGYVGTLGNGTPELKELVKGKKEKGFITEKTVNEDGLLEILKHFNV